MLSFDMPQNPSHTGLLLNHLQRVLFNKVKYPDRVEASIAELRALPEVSTAVNELTALLGALVAPTPIPEVVPVIPAIPDLPPEFNEMFFFNSFKELSAKLDQIISLFNNGASRVTSGVNTEVTSPEMAKLAAQVLNDPKSTKLNKKLAAALLTQAPDRK